MRLFGRILYALLAVGLFLLVFTYTLDLTANRYIEEVFGGSLTDEESDLPDFYYFYTSIPDYHKAIPIISIDQLEYQIRGYEVVQAEINESSELIVEEFVYIIVYSNTQDLSVLDKLVLTGSDSSIDEDIYLIRFKTLNILNGVNDQGYVYLSKDLFLDNGFDTIKLVDDNQETIFESALILVETDFTVKENLEIFFEQEGKLPLEEDIPDLRDDFISPRIIHLDDDVRMDPSLFIKGLLIYFLILIISTYLIFFRRKKYE